MKNLKVTVTLTVDNDVVFDRDAIVDLEDLLTSYSGFLFDVHAASFQKVEEV